MKKLNKIAMSLTVVLLSSSASAAITLYEDETQSVTTDLLVNVFYSNSSIDKLDGNGERTSRDQSRVRIGFLPNYIGFNYNTTVSDLKIGARASFWVTLNDTDLHRGAEGLGTRSGIDVRQFYATIDADWGQILLGKDFGLFSRSNILTDELLLGHGQTSDYYGLVDGGNVSFGNIGSGYTYPFPKSQITYRTPDFSGFQLAVGVMDPNKSSADSSEDMPRFEAEATYTWEQDTANFKAYVSGVTQSSEQGENETDATGIAGGMRVGFAGFALNASGFSTEGLGTVAGLDTIITSESNESTGYLLQGSYTFKNERFVVSYGNTEVDTDDVTNLTYDNLGLAWFHKVNDNLSVVLEYNRTEAEGANSIELETNDVVAIGAVVTF